MAKDIKNLGASVHTRLLSLSKANRQSLELVLTRSAIERLLFRPNRLHYAGRFVRKGSMSPTSWFGSASRRARSRPVGVGDPSPNAMLATLPVILAQDTNDAWRRTPTMVWCSTWYGLNASARSNMAVSGYARQR